MAEDGRIIRGEQQDAEKRREDFAISDCKIFVGRLAAQQLCRQ